MLEVVVGPMDLGTKLGLWGVSTTHQRNSSTLPPTGEFEEPLSCLTP